MTNDTEGLRNDPLNTPPFHPGQRVQPKVNPLRSFTVEHCSRSVIHGRVRWVVYGSGDVRWFADDVELVPANSPESPDGSAEFRTISVRDLEEIEHALQVALSVAGVVGGFEKDKKTFYDAIDLVDRVVESRALAAKAGAV